MEHFAKIVNGWKLSIVLVNSTILHIRQGSEYASAISSPRERDSNCPNIEARLLMTSYKKQIGRWKFKGKQFPNDAYDVWYNI